MEFMTLLSFVDAIATAPRAAAPNVTFDFWQQFDAAEELEEVRLLRPSAYKALPPEPSHGLVFTVETTSDDDPL